MTVDEIFKNLATHMVKGFMTHEELANYYDFLALKGFKQCHEYHYLEEFKGYRKLYHYYTEHFNKILKTDPVDQINIIPSSWYNHTRYDVDINLKRESVKSGYEIWIKWEKETKHLYEQMYKELININQVAAAKFLGKYVCDVTKELKNAENGYLKHIALDFKIQPIIDEQSKLYHKYKKKICSI